MSPGIPPPRVPSLRPADRDARALTRVIRRLSHCPSDGSAASHTLLLVVFLVNGRGMPGARPPVRSRTGCRSSAEQVVLRISSLAPSEAADRQLTYASP